ncbi:MAG: hypothetical protein H8E44_16340 [Planctomycetes bacterium]|nr:hypothetical protein [Planctomycetota bacterium]MBL7037075.1 hypothetical protein [Pirellulaceae bacterium]
MKNRQDVKNWKNAMLRVTVFMLIPASSLLAGGLLNGDFETLDSSGFAANWLDTHHQPGAASVSHGNGFDSYYCLRINDTQSSKGAGIVSDKFDVTPDRDIRMRVRYFIDSSTVPDPLEIYLKFYNSVGINIENRFVTCTEKNKWATAEVSVHTRGDAVKAEALFYSRGANVGVTYFDRVVLGDEIIAVGKLRQLFIDDYIIEGIVNGEKRLHRARKTGPIMKGVKPWELDGIQINGTVIKEGPCHFKMWYWTWDGNSDKEFFCYATSTDGVNWKRPNVGVCDYGGSFGRDNNILNEGFNEGDFCANAGQLSVIKNPDGSGYYAYVVGKYNVGQKSEIWFSENGISGWNYVSTHINQSVIDACYSHPVYNRRFGDMGYMVYDDINKKYILSHKIVDWHGSLGGGKEREFYTVASSSLKKFPLSTRQGSLGDAIDEAQWGWLRAEPYGISIFPYQGAYVGFDWILGVTDLSGNQDGHINTHLVFSRDLAKQWKRPLRDQNPIIPNGPDGSFDDGLIGVSTSPIVVGDEFWLYYNGNTGLHQHPGDASIGIAKWRLDGFVSIDSLPRQEAVITTKPLTTDGRYLQLNVDAAGGSVRVRIEDMGGNELKGYSDTITSDGVARTVTWNGDGDLDSILAEPVVVRIYARGAKVYALQFTGEDGSSDG